MIHFFVSNQRQKDNTANNSKVTLSDNKLTDTNKNTSKKLDNCC